jgi:predicted MFS family arabinose efflux permease
MPDAAAGTASVARQTRAMDRDRGRWGTVVALGTGSFAIGTDMFLVAGILVGLAGDLGVTVGAAGLMVTVFALAFATGAPLLSAALGARPRRQVLLGSIVLFGLCAVMAALAPTLPALLATRVLAALAASVYVPAASAAAVAAVPASHRGRALGVILGGTSIAMVVGAPLGVLLAATLSWRAAFGLVAFLAAVTAVAARRSVARSAPPARSTLLDRVRPLRSGPVVGTLAVTILVMTSSNSTYTYLAVLFGPVAGPAGLGLVIGALGLGAVMGTWWGGTAADRWGGRRVVLLAVTALTAGFAALPLVATTVAGALTVAVVWGVATWAFVAAQQHRLVGLGVAPAPLLLALNSSGTHLGFAAGALLGGLVVDTAGAGSSWLLAVACAGAGLVLHIIVNLEVRS